MIYRSDERKGSNKWHKNQTSEKNVEGLLETRPGRQEGSNVKNFGKPWCRVSELWEEFLLMPKKYSWVEERSRIIIIILRGLQFEKKKSFDTTAMRTWCLRKQKPNIAVFKSNLVSNIFSSIIRFSTQINYHVLISLGELSVFPFNSVLYHHALPCVSI